MAAEKVTINDDASIKLSWAECREKPKEPAKIELRPTFDPAGSTLANGLETLWPLKEVHYSYEKAKDGDYFLTPTEAATMLGITTETLRTWANTGKIPYIATEGGHHRYLRSEIVKRFSRCFLAGLQSNQLIDRSELYREFCNYGTLTFYVHVTNSDGKLFHFWHDDENGNHNHPTWANNILQVSPSSVNFRYPTSEEIPNVNTRLFEALKAGTMKVEDIFN